MFYFINKTTYLCNHVYVKVQSSSFSIDFIRGRYLYRSATSALKFGQAERTATVFQLWISAF